MPRARRAPRKRSRLPKARRPAETKRLMSYALDFEEPLRDAMDFVRALKHLGFSLEEMSGNVGLSIVAVARAAEERLNDLHEVWDGLVKAARG